MYTCMHVLPGDVEQQTVTTILQYIYTGKLCITEDNAQALLLCATEMGVSSVTKQCEEFLQQLSLPRKSQRLKQRQQKSQSPQESGKSSPKLRQKCVARKKQASVQQVKNTKPVTVILHKSALLASHKSQEKSDRQHNAHSKDKTGTPCGKGTDSQQKNIDLVPELLESHNNTVEPQSQTGKFTELQTADVVVKNEKSELTVTKAEEPRYPFVVADEISESDTKPLEDENGKYIRNKSDVNP